MTSIFWIVLSPSDYSYNSRSESADRAFAIVNKVLTERSDRQYKFMRKYNVGIHDLDLLDRIIP